MKIEFKIYSLEYTQTKVDGRDRRRKRALDDGHHDIPKSQVFKKKKKKKKKKKRKIFRFPVATALIINY